MKRLFIPFLLFASTALAQPAPGSSVKIISGSGGNIADVTPAKELKVSGSFAIPAGSATAGKQDIGNASLASIFTAINTMFTELQAKTEPANTQIVGDGGGSITVDTVSLPLPAGAATSANQTTIIGHVDGIEATLTQINSGVPITTPLGDSAMDDVNDAVRVNIVAGGSGGLVTEYTEGSTDASITGPAVMMETAADTLEPIQGTVVGGLLVNLGANNDVTVTSGAITANLGTIGGAATEATLASADSALSSIDSNIITADTGNVTISTLPNEGQQTMANSISVAIASNQSPVPVSGPLTDVELRATPVDVNITGGGSSGTEYIEGATDATIAGVAAMWEDAADTLRAISMAKPLPVQPGTATTFPVSAASLPLPTGAATSANQTTIIGHVDGVEALLTSIDSDISSIAATDFATETTLASVDSSLTSIAAEDFATQTTLAAVLTELGQKTEPANTQIVGDGGGSITVDGPLTDAQLRATSVDVNITGGGSPGTEYTEGATDATITGTAAMMEGAANTLLPVQGTVTDGLLVNLGSNNDVTVTGSVDVTDAFALNTSVDGVEALLTTIDADTSSLAAEDFATETTLATLALNSSVDGLEGSVDGIEGILTTIDGDTGNLVTVFGTASLVLGTQADDVVNTADGLQTSNLNYVFDGTTWDRLRGTSADGALVNLGANNDVTVTGTVAVTQSGTWDEVGINDSGNSITVDAPVGTPTFVRLSDGTSAIATLPVSLASVPSHAVTNVGTFAVQASGDIANDIADSGNPVKVGYRAMTTNPTAVADGDRVDAKGTKDGVGVFTLNKPRALRVDSGTVTLTSTTETTLITAGAASVFHDLELVFCNNTSASAVRVDVRDATAGTVRFPIYVPAGDVRGISPSGSPVSQAASANNWTVQLSAAVTDVRCFAQAVKNL